VDADAARGGEAAGLADDLGLLERYGLRGTSTYTLEVDGRFLCAALLVEGEAIGAAADSAAEEDTGFLALSTCEATSSSLVISVGGEADFALANSG
jgi:hypothetical protein